ncbi:hypothetical protein [Gordonia aichiensis]
MVVELRVILIGGLDPVFARAAARRHDGIEQLLRSSGQFGPAVPVDDDADPITRLVGFIGRDPAWRPEH